MESPNFHLEGIVIDKEELADFDGPLSLILILLQKNKIEIRDLKISEILDQYLEYLDKMQELDLEIASEFVRMASYLLYIKTKTILSSDAEEPSELEILMESLEQLKAKDTLEKIEAVIPDLSKSYKNGALYAVKPPEPIKKVSGEYSYNHDVKDLLSALYSVLSVSKDKAIDTDTLEKSIPHKVVYSVKNKSRHILARLRLRDIKLSELYSECCSKSEVVATFVSVLELCAMGSIAVNHTKDGQGYELSFIGGDVDNILEKIIE